MNKSITNIALFFAVAGLLVLQGCSGGNSLGTVNVSGTVTLDGTPVAGVNVSFIPTGSGGRDGYGVTNAQGRFVLTTPGAEVGSGLIPGEYSVTFTKMSNPLEGVDTTGMDSDEIDREMARRFPRGLPSAENLLPEKYANRNATPIEPVTVERGKRNDFTFNLSSE